MHLFTVVIRSGSPTLMQWNELGKCYYLLLYKWGTKVVRSRRLLKICPVSFTKIIQDIETMLNAGHTLRSTPKVANCNGVAKADNKRSSIYHGESWTWRHWSSDWHRKYPNVCATVFQCLVIDSVVKTKFCMWQCNALLYHVSGRWNRMFFKLSFVSQLR